MWILICVVTDLVDVVGVGAVLNEQRGHLTVVALHSVLERRGAVLQPNNTEQDTRVSYKDEPPNHVQAS